jgi:hypothetical protein
VCLQPPDADLKLRYEVPFNVLSVKWMASGASALRFGNPRVQALFAVLAAFSLQLQRFTNAELRALLAPMLALDPATYPAGRMTCDLRRLRLSRHHRTHPARPSPPTDQRRLPHCLVLLPDLCPAATIMPAASPTPQEQRLAA